jgi:hypothetical protein
MDQRPNFSGETKFRLAKPIPNKTSNENRNEEGADHDTESKINIDPELVEGMLNAFKEMEEPLARLGGSLSIVGYQEENLNHYIKRLFVFSRFLQIEKESIREELKSTKDIVTGLLQKEEVRDTFIEAVKTLREMTTLYALCFKAHEGDIGEENFLTKKLDLPVEDMSNNLNVEGSGETANEKKQYENLVKNSIKLSGLMRHEKADIFLSIMPSNTSLAAIRENIETELRYLSESIIVLLSYILQIIQTHYSEEFQQYQKDFKEDKRLENCQVKDRQLKFLLNPSSKSKPNERQPTKAGPSSRARSAKARLDKARADVVVMTQGLQKPIQKAKPVKKAGEFYGITPQYMEFHKEEYDHFVKINLINLYIDLMSKIDKSDKEISIECLVKVLTEDSIEDYLKVTIQEKRNPSFDDDSSNESDAVSSPLARGISRIRRTFSRGNKKDNNNKNKTSLDGEGAVTKDTGHINGDERSCSDEAAASSGSSAPPTPTHHPRRIGRSQTPVQSESSSRSSSRSKSPFKRLKEKVLSPRNKSKNKTKNRSTSAAAPRSNNNSFKFFRGKSTRPKHTASQSALKSKKYTK